MCGLTKRIYMQDIWHICQIMAIKGKYNQVRVNVGKYR